MWRLVSNFLGTSQGVEEGYNLLRRTLKQGAGGAGGGSSGSAGTAGLSSSGSDSGSGSSSGGSSGSGSSGSGSSGSGSACLIPIPLLQTNVRGADPSGEEFAVYLLRVLKYCRRHVRMAVLYFTNCLLSLPLCRPVC